MAYKTEFRPIELCYGGRWRRVGLDDPVAKHLPVFAEGDKEAAFREAEARERLAEAEAKATTMVSEAIARGDIQAVNYFVAQKYVEALQTIGTAPNQKLIFMPMEASGVIGAIGGVAELAKSAMQKGGA